MAFKNLQHTKQLSTDQISEYLRTGVNLQAQCFKLLGNPSDLTYATYVQSVLKPLMFGITSIPKISIPAPPEGGNWYGSRGIWGGGHNGSYQSLIDYIAIAVGGTASSFGNLARAENALSACSNVTRGVFFGGSTSSPVANIDYVTIATPGNSSNFGNLVGGVRMVHGTVSDGTRGVSIDGNAGSGYTNYMEYVTIASTGNSTFFGNANTAIIYTCGLSDSTRGVFGGGQIALDNNQCNIIEYITIQTTGTSTTFGQLTVQRGYMYGMSDTTRGIFSGGYNRSSVTVATMDYITVQTTGNATTFGNLTVSRLSPGTVSDGTYGVAGGGYNSTTSHQSVIDYVTIQTTGDAASWGNLSLARNYMGACSGN